ncbi:hypothetical protein EV193_105119 [Herbihabitans rhizosphaerae]|uniref:Uncharacterized protein n=1 Tax=Herbihabitans rhizosphaerae TaxID=1872711 RepID=A0A4V2ESH2_9PSEU|nr:hypothetical protein [Herbihabitans rhizosphaerae]RZS37563.1 hypothetical protein EV193_105119 [Herbihabitans rhizosphaerae]
MWVVLEILGSIMVIQGGAGLVHEWFGWLDGSFLVRLLTVLDGYEVAASAALIVLGVAAVAIGNARTRESA